MNENEIKMQAEIFQLRGICDSYQMSIAKLESMNEFLRSIIEMMIRNEKD